MATEPLGDIELIHGFEPPEKRKKPIAPILLAALIIAALAYLAYLLLGGKGFWEPNPQRFDSDNGYYTFNETTYYKQGGSWYEYDDGMGWIIAAPGDEFLDNYGNYFEGDLYSRDFVGSETELRIHDMLINTYATAFVYGECMLTGSVICSQGEGKAGGSGQASSSSPESEIDYNEDNDW